MPQYLPLGVVSTPANWVIPESLALNLELLFAHYDGTGAATSYIPCLEIISDSGDTAALVPMPTAVAAASSVEATWGPFLAASQVLGTPGAVIQNYFAHNTAADFTWTAAGNVSSGWPVNNTFTKLSSLSALQIVAEGDFTVGATVPDYIAMGLWIDGVNQINVAHHASIANAFFSVQIGRVLGVGDTDTPLAAGAHTLDVKVQSLLAQTTTFRCHAAANLTILEIVNPS